MFSTLCNCGRSSEGERGPEKYTNVSLQEKTADRANAISAEALDILEEHAGKQEEAIAALRKYISQTREEVLGIRRYFHKVRENMNPEDLAAFEEKMKEDREPFNIRAETLLRTFEDHLAVRRVLKLVY